MTVISPVGTDAAGHFPTEPSIAELRGLVRRILASGALDFDANEELELALWTQREKEDGEAGATEVAALAELSAHLETLLAGGVISDEQDRGLRWALIALDSEAMPGHRLHELAQLAWASQRERLEQLAAALQIALPQDAAQGETLPPRPGALLGLVHLDD